MKKIVVASKNPVKINATLSGFQKMFPGETFEAEGVSVPSGVSDQPKNDAEIFRGAWNRADNASKAIPSADFWVGIEGGIEEKNREMESFAWIIIKGENGKFGKGRTGTFFLPPRVAELIRQGKDKTPFLKYLQSRYWPISAGTRSDDENVSGYIEEKRQSDG